MRNTMTMRTLRRGISRGDPEEKGPQAVNAGVAAVAQSGGAAAEAGGDAEAEARLGMEETMIL
jgi:hypothetical protein